MAERRHPGDDVLLDVALGSADGAARDAVTVHLAACGPCRRDYDELADGIEQVLPAVPRVAPPPDFEASVLARLGEHRASPGRVAGSADRAWWRRRSALLPVAAGALLGVAVGAGVVGALGPDRPGGVESPPASSAEWSAPLLTDDGSDVGRVARSFGADGPALVVEVTGGEAGRRYACRLLLDDGTTRDAGQWELAQDRPNSWVVDEPSTGVRAVELVGESGGVWATAEL